MFDNQHPDNSYAVSDALEALGQLEQNTSEAVIRQRASKRLEIRTKVWIQPANASQRDEFRIEGLTGDISSGGCLVLSGRPTMAGDLYMLTFPDKHVSIGSLIAKCMRCRVVRGDTFEVGFRFFEDVEVSSVIREPD